MMNDSHGSRQAEAGLCASCVHVHVVRSDRGSRFYRCGLAATDPRFAKYPRLPVLSCIGFVLAGEPPKDAT
jgi:hypothetical protein